MVEKTCVCSLAYSAVADKASDESLVAITIGIRPGCTPLYLEPSCMVYCRAPHLCGEREPSKSPNCHYFFCLKIHYYGNCISMVLRKNDDNHGHL